MLHVVTLYTAAMFGKDCGLVRHVTCSYLIYSCYIGKYCGLVRYVTCSYLLYSCDEM